MQILLLYKSVIQVDW